MKKLLLSLALFSYSVFSFGCITDDTLFSAPIKEATQRYELCDQGSKIKFTILNKDHEVTHVEYADENNVYKIYSKDNKEELEGYFIITHSKYEKQKRRHVFLTVTRDEEEFSFYQLYLGNDERVSFQQEFGLAFSSSARFTRFKELD